MGKRFTFADAKEKIKELEQSLAEKTEELKQKAGDAILDTEDNIFTDAELKKIKYLEGWLPISLVIIVGLIVALVS